MPWPRGFARAYATLPLGLGLIYKMYFFEFAYVFEFANSFIELLTYCFKLVIQGLRGKTCMYVFIKYV